MTIELSIKEASALGELLIMAAKSKDSLPGHMRNALHFIDKLQASADAEQKPEEQDGN
ncbi:hypothetical protein N9937_02150 [bacterium]|nr:hypothetical protein [bacterium]